MESVDLEALRNDRESLKARFRAMPGQMYQGNYNLTVTVP
jgi:hypothetical protein